MKTSPKIRICGPTALALAGGALGVSNSQAAIVYTPVTSGGTFSNGASIWFDIGEDGTGAWSSVSQAAVLGCDFQIAGSFGYMSIRPATAVGGSNNRGRSNYSTSPSGPYSPYSVKMSLGDPIGSGITTWGSDITVGYGASGNFKDDDGHGYLGLRVEPTVGTLRYGWAEVSYNTDGSLTLYGFAVQTDGTAINAGAVPEPAQTGVMAALLAGGFAAWRRRAAFKRAA